MSKLQLCLILHNHQPVGNFDTISERAYERAYLPFLRVLQRHPTIKLTLHYSGILLEWLLRRHPDVGKLLRGFIENGQVEMLTGGYYEPIMAILPDSDKEGQIRRFSSFLERELGSLPQGLWLAERVWEPQLVEPLAAAGIHYTILDDYHFKMAGINQDQLFGYYLTDEQESLLAIFPGSERLRYLIPFQSPTAVVDYLKGIRSQHGACFVAMADDGEKFGIWPGTHRLVYEEGWLEAFFSLVEKNNDWLETSTCSLFLKDNKPLGRVYLPTCSYREMGEWALSLSAILENRGWEERLSSVGGLDEVRPYLRGGLWRNFLVKYPESHHLYRKMLHVSQRVHYAAEKERRRRKAASEIEETETIILSLYDELWKGQCNDAYWHGVFGGLYLPHLRSALYEHLIRAEVMADSILQRSKSFHRSSGVSRIDVERLDFDLDQEEEILIKTPLMSLLVDPNRGGVLSEFDYKPVPFNLMATLTRRREGYHDKISQVSSATQNRGATTIHAGVQVTETGLEKILQCDRYRRVSLIDHFLSLQVTLKDFQDCSHEEEGDFVEAPYRCRSTHAGRKPILTLFREGNVHQQGVCLTKTLTPFLERAGFSVDYELVNTSSKILVTRFGVEFNLSLLAGRAPDRYYEIPDRLLADSQLASIGEEGSVQRLVLVDQWLGLKVCLDWSSPATLWRFPIETVSQSEKGLERIYQGSVVFPHWPLELSPSHSWRVQLIVAVEGL